MKAYIKQTTETSLFEQAKVGFIKMGYETIYYNNTPEDLSCEDILVGYIGDVNRALKQLGKSVPPPIDYPLELNQFLGREIKETTLSYIANNPNLYPIFIKPINHKEFAGVVINSFKDLIGVVDTPLYSSEIVNIISEYRVFVIEGEIVGVKHYKGCPYTPICEISAKIIIEEYKTAPKSYAVDIGVTEEGDSILIEVNDGYSVGNYGLGEITYARVLMARWKEMME